VPYFACVAYGTWVYTALRNISREILAMPRRPSNVNQADLQRVIRAHQREKVPFRVTLQPNGAAVFESATVPATETGALDQWRSERGQS